ncbi:hypothetical protein Q8F55_003586 [Vanrija albida]|uniref:Uncharacterized protein n=1 Tax=Vanrija albida TaxID=181172 RepID=A0ABR3Q5F2_9TREE
MKLAAVALALLATVLAAPAPNLVTDNTESVLDNACSAECDFVTFAAPKLGGEDAHPLCNDEGRRAMLLCAQCIDEAYPGSGYEHSARSEYDIVIAACDQRAQPFWQ